MKNFKATDCDVTSPLMSSEKLRVNIGIVLLFSMSTFASGCPSNRLSSLMFHRNPEFVLDMDISKEDLVAHLNKNVLGSETNPGLSGWKTHDADVRLSGIPFQFSTSIAVQAPKNLRILVSKPTGGQAVDIGSNGDKFWFWTYEQPELLVCHHEDTDLAMQHMQVPIQIDPDWLMEVFGVMPIETSDYVIDRPSASDPIIDLVAISKGTNGVSVEKLIRVNAISGHIDSHILRKLDGEILAQAHLGDYKKMPNGSSLPNSIRISLPLMDKQIKITLGDVEPNPPSLAAESTLWAMPVIQGVRVVDVGKLSRYALHRDPRRDVTGPPQRLTRESLQEPGGIPFEAGVHLSAPVPLEIDPTAGEFPATAEEPEWAGTQTANRPTSSRGWQRSEYSAGAWQSSSVRHPPGQE